MINRCGRCGVAHARAGTGGSCPLCGATATDARMCGLAHMRGGRAVCPHGGCVLFRSVWGADEGPGDPCPVEAMVGGGPGAPLVAATLDALRERLQPPGGVLRT